jgi:transcriptional regulator with XRE-family HTH domain
MKTTVDFLDAVRDRHGLTSDYQLAKVLAVGQSTISHYRKGRSAFDEAMACKVAALLELPAEYVFACTASERAKDPEIKKIWARAARKLRG